MREMTKSLSKISFKSSSKQTDYEKFSSLWTKIWYCGGDVLHGRIFEFSIRSEIRRGRIRIFYFLLGQKFIAVEFKFEFCEGCPPLAMPNSTNIPVSHIILYELSDCILYRQTNGTLWINFSMFFWKISSKKSTFLRFTHQNLLTPPPNFTLVVKFFYFFFLVASLINESIVSWMAHPPLKNCFNN